MTGSHECGGDAAAYLLGALEPTEAEAFRQHLTSCVVCQDEVSALEGVVGVLPMAAPQYAVPRGLRRRVLRAVRSEPHVGARARAQPGPNRRRASAWNLRTAMAAGMAAILIVVAVALTQLGGGSHARVIHASVVGVPGTASLRLVDGHGELIVHDMPAPPAGKVYEVWVKPNAGSPRPTSALFTTTTNGSGDVGIPGSLRGVSVVMVTPEPSGGSKVPTHTPVVVARLD